ncbi:DTW domain-containing protein 2 [Armadillidium nasatum]|uniref:tRNA-uridine aminocarboxypropyltransferase n=1 Tax=Armadillidium nasatum TaxID=96803 RepID=A0A5N5T1T5_9CRUS|nr:DTW domain-containing protein 2 [Armadillidium nasatum]
MEINEENELALFADLVEIEIGRREKRPMCETCGCPELKNELSNENSILMYPGQNAVDIEDLPPGWRKLNLPYNIFILDGTWQQAKSMFFRNPYLRDLKQVRLSGRHISEYVIRRQPTDDALSTVEVVAVALSTFGTRLENIFESCGTSETYLPISGEILYCIFLILMDHGAVKHHSKEYLILTGRYKKPVGKRTYKKFKKCGVRNSDPCVWELRRNLNESEVGNREDKSNLNGDVEQLDFGALCIEDSKESPR